MKLLSLVMIVRNEATLLPNFLKHHADLFDEMIIVDTGSEDVTPQLVVDSGATLVRHQWNDDFSEARNVGQEMATGRWLLLLDADEQVASSDFPVLRLFLEKAQPAVYLQKTINYFSGTRHLEWQPVRGVYPQEETGQTGFFEAWRAGLFPNDNDLFFSGRVHESVLPAAEIKGLEKFRLDIPVHHYGYVLSSQINTAREARYLDLVSLKLEDNPEDWAAMLEMASIHLENSLPDEAKELLLVLVDGPNDHPAVNRGRFLLGRVKHEEGDHETARHLLLKAREADPVFLFAWLEAIRLEAAFDRWSRVSTLLSEARTHFPPEEPLLQRENLMLLVKTGQLKEAAAVARLLADNCPQWQEITALAEKLEKLKKLGKLA